LWTALLQMADALLLNISVILFLGARF